jgi:hypothetical protein
VKRRPSALLLTLGLLLGLGSVAAATPALADGVTLTVPQGNDQTLVADYHGHLFLSGGYLSTTLLVLDKDGAPTASIPEPGSTGMALAADGATLYVADGAGAKIVAIDTTTLVQTAEFPTPPGSCPQQLAVVLDTLWYSDPCATGNPIESIALAGDHTPVPGPAALRFTNPLLRAVPGDDTSLLVANRDVTGPGPVRLDVTGVPLQATSSDGALAASLANAVDLAVPRDGATVVLTDPDTDYDVSERLSDLSQVGTYPANGRPTAVAVSDAQGLLASGSRLTSGADSLLVYRLGGTAPIASFGIGDVVPAGLAWSPTGDRLYALTLGSDPTTVSLHVFQDPSASGGTNLIATVDASQPAVAATVNVVGQLEIDGTPAPVGTSLQVTRTDSAGTTQLPDVLTAADGSYAFADRVSRAGLLSYVVSWAGDGSHASMHATASSQAYTPAPPAAPQGLTATPGAGYVEVAFDPAALDRRDPVDSYTLYRGSSPSTLAPYLTGLSPAGPAHDPAPPVGQQDFYALAAVNGVGAGPLSAPVSAAPWSASYAGTFARVAPYRLLDTRSGVGGFHGALPGGHTLHLQVTGRGDAASHGLVPSGATAVVLNLTETNATVSSYLTAFPTGHVRPVASVLPARPGGATANLVTVALGTGGSVDIFNFAGKTDVVADLVGYYVDTEVGSPVVQGAYHMQDPELINATQGEQTLGASTTTQLPMYTAVSGSHVGAVLVSLQTDDPATAGYLTVWSGTGPRPATSNVNFRAHESTANLAVVQSVGAAMFTTLSVFNSSPSPVRLAVDVVGWYDSSLSEPGGLRFQVVVPTRIVDTRLHQGIAGALTNGQPNSAVMGAGLGDVRTAAIVANVTGIMPSAASAVLMQPSDSPFAGGCRLSTPKGTTMAGMFVSGLSVDTRAFTLTGYGGTTPVIVDVMGFFDQNLPLGS